MRSIQILETFKLNFFKLHIFNVYYLFKIFFNIYSFLRDRERQSVNRARADREGDTESEAGSRLRAVAQSPTWGLNSWTVKPWPELKSGAQLTEPPRHFNVYLFLREREIERAWAGEVQRQRGTEEPSWLWPDSRDSSDPDTGLKLMNHKIMTWAKVGCSTNWATQVSPNIRNP